METHKIEFEFKGMRDYIHGPDIFNRLTRAAGTGHLSKIRCTIHEFVRTPECNLYLFDNKDELAKIKNICAIYQFDEGGKRRWIVLTEQGGDASTGGRYEYDEEPFVSTCRIENEGVSMTQQGPFTFIENIVAMCKHMHLQFFPEVQGKWIFTRIDLDAICEARENLALQLRHNMNYRLTKSDILLDGKKIGNLYFSLVNL